MLEEIKINKKYLLNLRPDFGGVPHETELKREASRIIREIDALVTQQQVVLYLFQTLICF
jgi:hypothetical protein